MLTMLTLVLISFIEVAVYSYFVNPGQEVTIYDAHAELTAPYISGIFGFSIFFLVARQWKRKKFENLLKLILLFPLTYILLDTILLTVVGVQWSDFILIFTIANGAKFLGSYLGYRIG